MSCGLYYKHLTIINYASSGVNKLRASLNDDARVVIYDRHMFIVQDIARIFEFVELIGTNVCREIG
jgi:hypothetical protein